MKLDRRTRIAFLLILTLLAGLPGVLSAACGPCPARNAMPCCQSSATPMVKAPPCCGTVKTPAPVPASRAVEPFASAPVALAAPVVLALEPRVERPFRAPHPAPPLLHEGVGLYTLHAVFLI
ncbi:MAG TPA: hypothetical protein VGM86_22360 [Thermoanaerobaculia bacterium]|jgi:hypothetical protein